MRKLVLTLMLILIVGFGAGYSGSTAAADFATEGSLANDSSDVADDAEKSSFKTDVINFIASLPLW